MATKWTAPVVMEMIGVCLAGAGFPGAGGGVVVWIGAEFAGGVAAGVCGDAERIAAKNIRAPARETHSALRKPLGTP